MAQRFRVSTVVGVSAVVVAMSLVTQTTNAEKFSADFSKGRLISNMHVELNGCDFNPAYGGSLRMLYANKSYLKAQLYVQGYPNRGSLILDHQSSIDENSPRRGTSPITIEVNGGKVVRNYDPDHGYTRERFSVGRYLKHGWNTIRISYGNGTTHYWLRTMDVETK